MDFRDEKAPVPKLIFETSAEIHHATRGTTQIAGISLPLSGSINPYAFTQQSRRGSTRRADSAFFLTARKLQTRKTREWLAPDATSLNAA